jgi:hypothetical protein
MVMRRKFNFLALMLTVFCYHAVAAELNELTPFKAEFVAYRFGDDVGTATLELKKLDNALFSLTYSSKVSKFFLSDKRHEHSVFSIESGDIKPVEYNYKRSGTGKDSNLSVKFDPNSSQIVLDNGTTMPWQNEFDNQLFRIDIPRQLAAGKTRMDYSFINYRGQIRSYQIEFDAKEQLDLPYGMVDSIKLRIIRSSNRRQTFAWFSPSLDYALVRLQQFKDGDEQGDIRLKSFKK